MNSSPHTSVGRDPQRSSANSAAHHDIASHHDVAPHHDVVRKMPTFVVGFDFSLPSEDALDQALAYCSLIPGCQLHVAWAPMAALAERDFDPYARGTAANRLHDYMEQRLEGYQAVGISLLDLETRLHLLAGSPAEAILQLARDVAADTIVVGHDRAKNLSGGDSGGLHTGVRPDASSTGSIAAQIIDHAPCPVLVARPRLETLPESERTGARMVPANASGRHTRGRAGPAPAGDGEGGRISFSLHP